MGELLWSIVETCEGAADATGWTLAPRGESRLDAGRSLAETGVYPGAILDLIPPPPEAPAPAPPPPRIDSMREAEYRELLERSIRAARLTSKVVAVVAAQPGAGSTTVTALLASLVSTLRPEPVVAVDASPQTGALSHWLVPDHTLPAATYRTLLDPSVNPSAVESALAVASPRLAVLTAPLAVGEAEPDAQSWTRLIDHLRRLRHLVVIDCGAGMQRAAVRAAVSTADATLFVIKAEAPANPPGTWQKPTVLVVNQGRRRARMRRSNAKAAQVTVILDGAAAARLRHRGFDWNGAPPAWQEALRELASVLLASG